MKLAGHTLATPELELGSALRLFARLGLSGVEIVQDDDYRCGIPTRPSVRKLRELRQDLTAFGLVAVHITPYVRTLDSLDSADREIAIESMRTAIECAGQIGAGGVRVLAGRIDGEHREERRLLFLDSLQVLDASANAASVSLNIESKGWSFAADAATMLRVIEGVNRPSVGVLFDPANLFLDGFDPVQELASQRHRVRHVHVKDLRSGSGGGYEMVPLGQGQIPWTILLRRLRDSGYDGYLSLEYERRWHPDDLPSAAEALPGEIDFLKVEAGAHA